MRNRSIKGFIFLDVLLSLSLFITIIFLCGNFTQSIRCFGSKSVMRQKLISQYYFMRKPLLLRKETEELIKIIGVIDIKRLSPDGSVTFNKQKKGFFTVVNNECMRDDYLYVRFDNAEI